METRISAWIVMFDLIFAITGSDHSIAIASVPSDVLSPVIGDIEVVSSLNQCSIPPTKWCFNQHKTGYHTGGAICGSDDTFAWDANLNTPVWDSDAEMPVYAIENGVVTQTYGGGCTNAAGSFGQVLIEHNSGGTAWWSSYLHLTKIQVKPLQTVGPNSIIGYISNIGVPDGNNHLHFGVYQGKNTNSGLISFNANITPRSDSTPISDSTSMDVYFLVDLSSSFADDLPVFKAEAPVIISNMKASNPNIRFGIGKYEDYPVPPFGDPAAGDKAYQRLVDLTSDTDLVLATIAGLTTRAGGDDPESQPAALYQAATGEGQDLTGVGFPEANIPSGQQANFRAGAAKQFLLWTDAPFHKPGDSGTIPYPGPSLDEAKVAIQALGSSEVILNPSGDGGVADLRAPATETGAKVIGISSGGGGIADLEAIAAATGALAPAGGVDCNEDGIIDVPAGEPLVCSIGVSGEGIAEAIIALTEAAAEPMPPSPPLAEAPNLQPTEITFDPSTAVVGGTVFFDSGVSNTGDVDSGIFNIQWLVNGQDVEAAGSHAGIPASQTILDGNSHFSWTFDSPGTYSVTFTVDVDNHIEESNEQDNSMTINVVVGQATDSPPPEPPPLPPSPEPQPTPLTFNVDATLGWQTITLEVVGWQNLFFSAVGAWSVDPSNFSYVGPDGYTPEVDSLIQQDCKLAPQVPYGMLIAKVDDYPEILCCIGSETAISLDSSSGILSFRINEADACLVDNAGSVTVTVSNGPISPP